MHLVAITFHYWVKSLFKGALSFYRNEFSWDVFLLYGMKNEWIATFRHQYYNQYIQSNQLIYSITIDSLLSIIDSLTCVLKCTGKPLHIKDFFEFSILPKNERKGKNSNFFNWPFILSMIQLILIPRYKSEIFELCIYSYTSDLQLNNENKNNDPERISTRCVFRLDVLNKQHWLSNIFLWATFW